MNVTFPMHAMISVFPTGDYKVTFYYTNKEFFRIQSIYNITGAVSVMTSNRDTFG